MVAALQLFKLSSSRLDRSSATDKAKHFAKSRIDRYPVTAFGFFSDKAAEFVDLNKGTILRLGLVNW